MKGTPEEPSVYKKDSLETHSPHLISRGSLLLHLDIMATKEKSLAKQITPKEQSSSRGDRSANTQQHQPAPRDTRERRKHSMSCDSFFNDELVTKFLSDPRVVTENAIKLTQMRCTQFTWTSSNHWTPSKCFTKDWKLKKRKKRKRNWMKSESGDRVCCKLWHLTWNFKTTRISTV